MSVMRGLTVTAPLKMSYSSIDCQVLSLPRTPLSQSKRSKSAHRWSSGALALAVSQYAPFALVCIDYFRGTLTTRSSVETADCTCLKGTKLVQRNLTR